ncbi:hypothetical protein F2Q68_00032409 [Brassica cretica]|uniref:Uncharacterized protein n=1 Tax=Brassica cretica TaxID=69181 RepID=A0A8S9GJT2_BRACR|nr:hypothetical protein F2Q68_00032409 [Brassica cretica]
MGATSRSDAMRSLQTTSQSDLAGATPRSRSPSHPGGSRKLTRSDLSERPLQVALRLSEYLHSHCFEFP